MSPSGKICLIKKATRRRVAYKDKKVQIIINKKNKNKICEFQDIIFLGERQ